VTKTIKNLSSNYRDIGLYNKISNNNITAVNRQPLASQLMLWHEAEKTPKNIVFQLQQHIIFDTTTHLMVSTDKMSTAKNSTVLSETVKKDLD